MNAFPRITFGIIVLNGEPFIRYTLDALYPFAHEIIVVEGAAPGAKNIATADGHSRDGTLESLRRYKATADSEDKLTIVTKDGFWSEKDEMSAAYAERATGDYLWQVDVDEFYLPEDIERIGNMLRAQPGITAMSFNTITFWGAPGYRVEAWHHRRGAREYHRLFKWGDGYRYVAHRPPTVLDERGRDLRAGHWLRGDDMERRGINLYHYALLLPKQVREKSEYYRGADWAQRPEAVEWAEEAFFALKRPYHLHNVAEYPACLYRYDGAHPPQLTKMWQDISAAGSSVQTRPTADIEALLSSRRYQAGRALLMSANRPALWLRRSRGRLKALLARCLPGALKDALRRQ